MPRQSSSNGWLSLAAFAIKPLHMLGTLVLIVILWRGIAPDLAALRWALVLFFLGEAFCLLNYLVFSDRSQLFDYLHGCGMALAFGFTGFALLEGIDRRLVHFSDPEHPCAAQPLCRGCIKHTRVPCGLRRAFPGDPPHGRHGRRGAP